MRVKLTEAREIVGPAHAPVQYEKGAIVDGVTAAVALSLGIGEVVEGDEPASEPEATPEDAPARIAELEASLAEALADPEALMASAQANAEKMVADAEAKAAEIVAAAEQKAGEIVSEALEKAKGRSKR